MRRYIAVAVAFVLGVAVALAVAQSRDAVIVDPTAHSVVLENEHVRVLEARASHGYKSPMHTHPSLAVISIGSARVKLTQPDGKSSMLDLRPGMVLWLDKPEHSWELISGELHVVAVEVKSAAGKAAAGK